MDHWEQGDWSARQTHPVTASKGKGSGKNTGASWSEAPSQSGSSNQRPSWGWNAAGVWGATVSGTWTQGTGKVHGKEIVATVDESWEWYIPVIVIFIAGTMFGGCIGYLWAFLKYRKTVQQILPVPQIPLPPVPAPVQPEDELPLPPRAGAHAAPAARRRGAHGTARGPQGAPEIIITTVTGDKYHIANGCGSTRRGALLGTNSTFERCGVCFLQQLRIEKGALLADERKCPAWLVLLFHLSIEVHGQNFALEKSPLPVSEPQCALLVLVRAHMPRTLAHPVAESQAARVALNNGILL